MCSTNDIISYSLSSHTLQSDIWWKYRNFELYVFRLCSNDQNCHRWFQLHCL